MATQEHTGTQAATPTTEHTLVTSTVAKTLKFSVDIGNLASGERVRLTQKRKVLVGDAVQYIEKSTIYNWLDAGVNRVVSLPAFLNGAASAVFTLTQLNGTGRNFNWTVESA